MNHLIAFLQVIRVKLLSAFSTTIHALLGHQKRGISPKRDFRLIHSRQSFQTGLLSGQEVNLTRSLAFQSKMKVGSTSFKFPTPKRLL